MSNLRIDFLKLILKLSLSVLLASRTLIVAMEKTISEDITPAAAPTPTEHAVASVTHAPACAIDTLKLRIIVPHSPHDTVENIDTIKTTPDTTSPTKRPKSARKHTPCARAEETHTRASICAVCWQTKLTKHGGPKRDCLICATTSPGTCDCLITRRRADTK